MLLGCVDNEQEQKKTPHPFTYSSGSDGGIKDGRDVPLLRFFFNCPSRNQPKPAANFPAFAHLRTSKMFYLSHIPATLFPFPPFFRQLSCSPPPTFHLLVLSSLSTNLIGLNASRSLRDQRKIRATLMTDSLSCNSPLLQHSLPTSQPSFLPRPHGHDAGVTLKKLLPLLAGGSGW